MTVGAPGADCWLGGRQLVVGVPDGTVGSARCCFQDRAAVVTVAVALPRARQRLRWPWRYSPPRPAARRGGGPPPLLQPDQAQPEHGLAKTPNPDAHQAHSLAETQRPLPALGAEARAQTSPAAPVGTMCPRGQLGGGGRLRYCPCYCCGPAGPTPRLGAGGAPEPRLRPPTQPPSRRQGARAPEPPGRRRRRFRSNAAAAEPAGAGGGSGAGEGVGAGGAAEARCYSHGCRGPRVFGCRGKLRAAAPCGQRRVGGS